MKDGEIPRTHGTRYSDTLDEMLGIRSKNVNMIQKGYLLVSRLCISVELSKQIQLIERPATRHGRYGEPGTAPIANDSFPLPLRLGPTDKSDVTVELWQRECEDEERSDDDDDDDDDDNEKEDDQEEEEEESNYHSSDTNGTAKKSRQEVETINEKCQNDAVAIAQETTRSSAINTAGSENRFQRSIDTSHQGQNFDHSIGIEIVRQKIGIVKQKNQSSDAASNSSVIEKTTATESQVSEKNLPDSFRIQSMYTISRDKTNNELKKPVEKQSRITTLSASPSGKAAYEKWFREKSRQEREKRRKEKEKEEEERKAREERRKEAERNYEIWKQRSDEAIRERRIKKKEKEEALAKEKIEEMRRKKEEATQMFQAWKNDRLQRLSKERKQHIKNKENDEQKKKREMEIRSNEAQKAFNAWYEENKIRNLEAQRKLLKSRKTEEIQNRNTKEYKEALAREAYDVWLQIKESERLFNESLQGRIMKFDEMSRRSHLVPWVPPSNIVPRQFNPARSRRHQSVRRTIKSNQAYKKFPSTIHRSKSAIR
uniref:CCDC34 domain-containing protein n=1 Tax=Elaeophora elaphi TaxID=1147741 RepID=A0A0R3RW27_9BILA